MQDNLISNAIKGKKAVSIDIEDQNTSKIRKKLFSGDFTFYVDASNNTIVILTKSEEIKEPIESFDVSILKESIISHSKNDVLVEDFLYHKKGTKLTTLWVWLNWLLE
jgi:hypothetical protein